MGKGNRRKNRSRKLVRAPGPPESVSEALLYMRAVKGDWLPISRESFDFLFQGLQWLAENTESDSLKLNALTAIMRLHRQYEAEAKRAMFEAIEDLRESLEAGSK